MRAYRQDTRRRIVWLDLGHGPQAEEAAWATTPLVRGASGPVRVVENGVVRGPAWTFGGHVMKAGTWFVGLLLDGATWKKFTAGQIGPEELMEKMKGNAMKAKKMKKLEKSFAGDWLASVRSGSAEPGTANAALRRVGVAGTPSVMSAVLRPFDARVDNAEAALAKAKATDNDYGVAVGREELRAARYARTAMKMVAAENARERDPAMVTRGMRGQGVPLVSNRHALLDDPGIRYE